MTDTARRLKSAEERITALERDRWDRAEFETRKRDFIREAALRIFLQDRTRNVTCWEEARVLWDSKPEDC